MNASNNRRSRKTKENEFYTRCFPLVYNVEEIVQEEPVLCAKLTTHVGPFGFQGFVFIVDL